MESDAPFEFEMVKRILVRDIDEFDRVCMEYFFKNSAPGEDPQALIFAKRDTIFELNIWSEAVTTIH